MEMLAEEFLVRDNVPGILVEEVSMSSHFLSYFPLTSGKQNLGDSNVVDVFMRSSQMRVIHLTISGLAKLQVKAYRDAIFLEEMGTIAIRYFTVKSARADLTLQEVFAERLRVGHNILGVRKNVVLGRHIRFDDEK